MWGNIKICNVSFEIMLASEKMGWTNLGSIQITESIS